MRGSLDRFVVGGCVRAEEPEFGSQDFIPVEATRVDG